MFTHRRTRESGFIASFESAGSAIACAIAMQRDLATYNARNPETPIRIRAGLHAGKALPVEDRLLGAAVNATVRIASVAEPGEILISDAVREISDEARLELRDRGLALLKGFAERFRLYEVVWA